MILDFLHIGWSNFICDRSSRLATKKPGREDRPRRKKRANKYDEKLKVNGTFEDLVKELITPKNPTKKK